MGGAIVRKLVYNSLAIILLCVSGGAQFGIAFAKNKVSQDETIQLIMSIAFSLTVSVLNLIIQIVLAFTSRRQRN